MVMDDEMDDQCRAWILCHAPERKNDATPWKLSVNGRRISEHDTEASAFSAMGQKLITAAGIFREAEKMTF